jgi:gliding motility-associated lipoprotein GldH
MHTRRWIFGWLLASLLGGCEQGVVYSHSVVLEGGEWPVEEVLDFSFQIDDAAQTYDVYLLLESRPDYPYQNFYVTYYLQGAAEGGLLGKALRHYEIFDLKSGKPLGSGLGRCKQHQYLLVEGCQFPQPGTYTLGLEHFMRTDILHGLHAVGIKVLPSQTSP